MLQKPFPLIVTALLGTQSCLSTLPATAEQLTQNPIALLPPAPQQESWPSGSPPKPSERWQGFIERALEEPLVGTHKAVSAAPVYNLAPTVKSVRTSNSSALPVRSVNEPLRDTVRRKNLALPLKN